MRRQVTKALRKLIKKSCKNEANEKFIRYKPMIGFYLDINVMENFKSKTILTLS